MALFEAAVAPVRRIIKYFSSVRSSWDLAQIVEDELPPTVAIVDLPGVATVGLLRCFFVIFGM